jgi:hypothetical protein
VLAALTAGCGGHHAASDEAILAVQKSARGKAFWFFPSRATSVRCAIPGDAPPHGEGIRIAGRCTTRVEPHVANAPGTAVIPRGTAVIFTESWPRSAFSRSGSTTRMQKHAWRFLVSPTGEVVLDRESGDIAPNGCCVTPTAHG